MYDSSLKYKWDNQNVLEYAVKEAKHNKALDIARELKREGLAIDFIAKTTKLAIGEIEKL